MGVPGFVQVGVRSFGPNAAPRRVTSGGDAPDPRGVDIVGYRARRAEGIAASGDTGTPASALFSDW